jgi:GNAT superfamily N-acetyltransferase
VSDSILLLHTPGQLAVRLGSSLAQAFSDAPDYSFILSGHPDKQRALAWFFGRFAARLSLRHGSIHVTEDGSAGILTMAPGKSPSLMTLLQAGVLAFPRHFGWLGTWRAFSLGIYMERRRLELAPMPHWYVLAVGVAPESQGQGLGYDLVTRTIRRAEAEDVPCYLEAFEEKLVEHYERRGFRVLAKDQLPTGLTLWCMLREPSTVVPSSKTVPASKTLFPH